MHIALLLFLLLPQNSRLLRTLSVAAICRKAHAFGRDRHSSIWGTQHHWRWIDCPRISLDGRANQKFLLRRTTCCCCCCCWWWWWWWWTFKVWLLLLLWHVLIDSSLVGGIRSIGGLQATVHCHERRRMLVDNLRSSQKCFNITVGIQFRNDHGRFFVSVLIVVGTGIELTSPSRKMALAIRATTITIFETVTNRGVKRRRWTQKVHHLQFAIALQRRSRSSFTIGLCSLDTYHLWSDTTRKARW